MKYIMENWKKFLSEVFDDKKIDKSFTNFLDDLASDAANRADPTKGHPYYSDMLNKLESPKDVQKKDSIKKIEKKGKINPNCNCVDRSESSLTVREIQKTINFAIANGRMNTTPLKETGNCDKQTKLAILLFQTKTGIQQDGCVGDETEGKMIEIGILNPARKSEISTQSYPAKPGEEAPVSQISPPGSVGSYSAGVTISIKANKEGRRPHYKSGPNFHGYGKDTASMGITSNDSYFVNGINFADYLSGVNGIKIRPGRRNKQFGNPLLAKIIKSAAEETTKFKRSGGEAWLADVSLGRCHNEKERRKDPSLPCIQGGHGPALGSHRFGHQSGLEADITFYKMRGASAWWNPVSSNFSNFDFERNCTFTEVVLSSDQIQLVLVGGKVIKKMREWVIKNNAQSSFPNLMSSGKLAKAAGSGHDDHYHIRAEFPPNSPNMHQFKSMLRTGNAIIAQTSFKSSTPSGNKRFKYIAEKTLDQIKKLYPRKTQFSYTFGTVDGVIIEEYNQNTLFYGASMPKTMAGLVQLVTYKNNPEKQLNKYELEGLLTYWRRRFVKGKPSTKKWLKWKNSNFVQRGISSTYGGSKKHKRANLGIITPQDVKRISRYFGISSKSGFLFGGGQNKQTTRDAFLFYAGLSRMDQEKFNNRDKQPGGLEEFYMSNMREVKRLIAAQKLRIYSPKLRPSGALNRRHWGKGGLYNGAVNFVFIIEDKYVLSVYTQVAPRVYIAKNIDFAQRTALKSLRMHNNLHGYDLLNAIIFRLLQKTK